jgi:hypothetical protein
MARKKSSDIYQAIRSGLLGAICLGALSVVAIIHLQWILFLPDPWFSPDTATYLGPALHLLSGKPFGLDTVRTPGYPLFLWVLLKTFHSLSWITISQHFLLLATGALTAVLAYHWIKKSLLFAIFIFAAISLMPWSLVTSHRALTETLYTFFYMTTVGLFAYAWKTNQKAAWIGVALSAMIGVFIRPAGVILFPAFILLVLLYRKQAQIKRGGLFAGIPILLLSIVWCSINLYAQGFWGFTTYGGRTLYGRVAYLLELDRVKPEELAEGLRPYYTPPDERLLDPDWVQNDATGPIMALRRQNLLTPKEDPILRRLAWSAIQAHPFRTVRDHANRSFRYLLSLFSTPPEYVSPIPTTLDSITQYQSFAKSYPEINAMAVFAQTSPEKYFAALGSRPLYPLQPGDWISSLCWPLRWLEKALPAWVLLALIFFGIKHRDPVFDLITLIGFFHILVTTMATWDLQPVLRHGVALEPLCLLLIARALFYWISLTSPRGKFVKSRHD